MSLLMSLYFWILQTEELEMWFQELVVILWVRFVERFRFCFVSKTHFDLRYFEERFRFALLMMMGFQAPDGEGTLF